MTLLVGVWAGNSYATSGCPGTCAQRLMDPANFVVRISQTPNSAANRLILAFAHLERIMAHKLSEGVQKGPS
jgi:hypothetical protein